MSQVDRHLSHRGSLAAPRWGAAGPNPPPFPEGKGAQRLDNFGCDLPSVTALPKGRATTITVRIAAPRVGLLQRPSHRCGCRAGDFYPRRLLLGRVRPVRVLRDLTPRPSHSLRSAEAAREGGLSPTWRGNPPSRTAPLMVTVTPGGFQQS